MPIKRKNSKGTLRRGWTTGACATAATSAAYQALLTGSFPDPITITLPHGQEPKFSLLRKNLSENKASASIIKDAGDDPDITHGAEIAVTVALNNENNSISFHAGDGVGIVTRPGLALDIGEPAINPGPRGMIKSAIKDIANKFTPKTSHGVSITISIPDGKKLAKKTMNGRLGIKGGLSILGTTGIVIPYSCSSWIHSIHRGVDVARAANIKHIAAATGSTSEAAVQKILKLEDTALIDMGDFAGGLLKYLRKKPVECLTIAGGIGKLTKLAQGAMDLHSSRSQVNMAGLAEMLSNLGADKDTINQVENANTASQVLELAQKKDLDLGQLIARQARESAMATLSGGTEVHVMVFDRNGNCVGKSNAKHT
ncbi:MAG: cobalt-precorrin-5B (C(1))-methyltransferase [Pseudomonadota bacterium]|nr:cobalt-precorrin-5B (C(1))-methyltransferase [Pseudomonadota bacterium]